MKFLAFLPVLGSLTVQAFPFFISYINCRHLVHMMLVKYKKFRIIGLISNKKNMPILFGRMIKPFRESSRSFCMVYINCIVLLFP